MESIYKALSNGEKGLDCKAAFEERASEVVRLLNEMESIAGQALLAGNAGGPAIGAQSNVQKARELTQKAQNRFSSAMANKK